MNRLDAEISTYNAKLPELIAHQGQFVLIKGSQVVGVFDTYQDALQQGYEKFGLDPFLVKTIAPAEQILFISRELNLCPA